MAEVQSAVHQSACSIVEDSQVDENSAGFTRSICTSQSIYEQGPNNYTCRPGKQPT